jgi:hypothetical protein
MHETPSLSLSRRKLLAIGIGMVITGIGLPRHLRIARLQDFPEVDIGWRQQQALAGSGEIGDKGIPCLGQGSRIWGMMKAGCPLASRQF